MPCPEARLLGGSKSSQAESGGEQSQLMLSLKPGCPVQARFVQDHAQIHPQSLEWGLAPSRRQRLPYEVMITELL